MNYHVETFNMLNDENKLGIFFYYEERCKTYNKKYLLTDEDISIKRT